MRFCCNAWKCQWVNRGLVLLLYALYATVYSSCVYLTHALLPKYQAWVMSGTGRSVYVLCCVMMMCHADRAGNTIEGLVDHL